MDWYPRYPAHYQRKTIGWRNLAWHGAYCLLIDYYMQTGGPIPDDDGAIASVLHCDMADWTAIAAHVRSKFTAQDGKLYNKRCDEELIEYQRRAKVSRENGRHGGRPPKNKKEKNKNPPKTQQDTQQQPASPPQTDRQTDRQTDKQNPPYPPSGGAGYSNSDFEKFWAAYPHRVEREAALDAFSHALTLTTLDVLIAGAGRYAETKPADLNWLKPAKWLKRERWNDDPAPSKAQPAPSTEATAKRAAELQAEDDLWGKRLLHFDATGNWDSGWGGHPLTNGRYEKTPSGMLKVLVPSRVLDAWKTDRTRRAIKRDGLLEKPAVVNGGGHKTPAQADGDDDLLDIPAFLRRQSAGAATTEN